MNISLYFIGPLIGFVIANMILKAMYKNVEKKDKGFVLNYHKLSYRRRFIRSLWGIPIALLLALAVYWLGDLIESEFQIIGFIFILLILLDIASSYLKWKKNEEEA